MPALIRARGLCKSYQVRQDPDSLLGVLRSLVAPRYEIVDAVRDVSLDVESGECVGFLGPNGAGKSTVIKLLCGIQTPTRGEIDVLGHDPQRRESALYRKIGVVFGHKSSLWWDLPLWRSFEMAKLIYRMEESRFQRNIAALTEALQLRAVLERPVRVLSLGERVKGELAMNLVFEPRLLFLDEPTIGLDIQSKFEIRSLLNRLRQETGLGIFLTSHDMGDIDGCCDRILLVDRGELKYSGTLSALKKQYGSELCVAFAFRSAVTAELLEKLAAFVCERARPLLPPRIDADEGSVRVQIAPGREAELVVATLAQFDVAVQLESLGLEEIMVRHFRRLQAER